MLVLVPGKLGQPDLALEEIGRPDLALEELALVRGTRRLEISLLDIVTIPFHLSGRSLFHHI